MQKTKHTKLAWVVTLTASLFFFYEFIQLIFPNAIDIQLMQSFNLNATQLGLLVSTYFWANALFLFPAGNLTRPLLHQKINFICHHDLHDRYIYLCYCTYTLYGRRRTFARRFRCIVLFFKLYSTRFSSVPAKSHGISHRFDCYHGHVRRFCRTKPRWCF